jgi:hypothetical protein
MVERFSKMFARALRALWDLRKAPLAVLVQNVGGQVNVGEQQVNVAPRPAGTGPCSLAGRDAAGAAGRRRVLARRIGAF